MQLDQLVATMQKIEVSSETFVIRQGEQGDNFYVVLDGQFEVFLEQVRARWVDAEL